MRQVLYGSVRYAKRSLFSFNFVSGVLIALIVLAVELVPSISTILSGYPASYPTGDFLQQFFSSFYFGYVLYAAPIISAFSCSAIYVEDIENGFEKNIQTRMGKRNYGISVFLVVATMGGLCLALSIMLFALICRLVFLPHIVSTDIPLAASWLPLLQGTGMLPVLSQAGCGFMLGSVSAVMGLTSTTFSPNRYVGYFIPFIIINSFHLLLLNLQATKYSIFELFVQFSWADFNFTDLFIYYSVIMISLCVLFAVLYSRRCENA